MVFLVILVSVFFFLCLDNLFFSKITCGCIVPKFIFRSVFMNFEKINLGYIQDLIGYEFKNSCLLQQAFTRRSFSHENSGFADNEILEFYGDVALNLYVSSEMSKLFGRVANGQYVSEKQEGELSEIRSKSVNKNRLSHCISVLGLEKFLKLGSTDIKNEVWKNDSVKEDLFEAIVGAVAIDSEWNSSDIKNACENLFSVSDFEANYIALLEEECKKRGWHLPRIMKELPLQMCFGNSCDGLSLMDRQTVNCSSSIQKRLFLQIPNIASIYYSDFNLDIESKNALSVIQSAKELYEWILRRDKIQKSVAAIDENLAVNQLHELWQKGLIKEPVYDFSESHDKDGNSIWNCKCKLAESKIPFEAMNASKKKAKQLVSAEALHFLVGEERELAGTKEKK